MYMISFPLYIRKKLTLAIIYYKYNNLNIREIVEEIFLKKSQFWSDDFFIIYILHVVVL